MSVSRRRFMTLTGGMLATAALAACSTSPGPAPSSSAPPSGGSDPLSSFDEVFQKAFAAAGIAGAAGFVRFGGQEWSGTAGLSDLATKEPFSATGTVRIASITKTFTATTVLQMVGAGLVGLDDTLDRWFPAISGSDVITLRQMLAMQSGIFDYTSDAGFAARFDADPTEAWSLDDTLAVIVANPPAFAPGAKTVYCDSNYYLLGGIAEQVDGSPLAEVIDRRVVQPLGLTGTTLPADTMLPDPHPTPYVPVVTSDGAIDTSAEPRVVERLNPAAAAGAGGMISTLADLSRWGDELVTGTLLTPEVQAERLMTHRFEGQTLDFGYGLGITNFNEYLGHDGAIYGFSTVVLTRPQTGTQIAIVSNESTNFTTPTITMAVAIIDAIDPGQGTGA